ncbi:hypothetical protein KY285_013774 [Solanum tuberosum]|nr:hypothetical protein KY285_013774 [Solanum tuberosum]
MGNMSGYPYYLPILPPLYVMIRTVHQSHHMILINHGVSSSVVEKMKHETQKFYDLPLEEKKKFERSPCDADGFGQLFFVFDEQKLDWADLFYLKTAPPHLRMPIFSKLYLSLRYVINATRALLYLTLENK